MPRTEAAVGPVADSPAGPCACGHDAQTHSIVERDEMVQRQSSVWVSGVVRRHAGKCAFCACDAWERQRVTVLPDGTVIVLDSGGAGAAPPE